MEIQLNGGENGKIHKRLTFVTLMKKWRHGHGAVRPTHPGSRQLVCQMNRSRKVRYASDRTLTSRRFFVSLPTVPELVDRKRKDKCQKSSLIPHNSRNSGGNEMENREAQITSFNMVLFKAGNLMEFHRGEDLHHF